MPVQSITTIHTFNEWRNIINSAIGVVNGFNTAGSVTIAGGSINGTSIGASSPAGGKFTNLSVTSTLILTGASIQIDADNISGDAIHGGTISNVIVELPALPTAASHATNKAYVDSTAQTTQSDSMVYAILFGN